MSKITTSEMHAIAPTVKNILSKSLQNVDRVNYLKKELRNHCSAETLAMAIEHNPAYAGIGADIIDKIAQRVINSEVRKASCGSFVVALPGGLALFATIPADVLQSQVFYFRIKQKLAYLYGCEHLLEENSSEDVSPNREWLESETMNVVDSCNKGIKVVASGAATCAAKELTKKSCAKAAYEITSKAASHVGVKMTRVMFAQCVAKAIPVIGGLGSAGLTYLSLKSTAKKLKEYYSSLEYCKLANYQHNSLNATNI